MKYKQILNLLIIAFVILFVIQNTVVVEIQFLFWNIAMSRAILILFCVIIGILLGWLLSNYISIKRKK
jgi:uncharacterized integral membrane protein